MLSDLIQHVDLLLVVVLTLIIYKLIGSPLHGLVTR